MSGRGLRLTSLDYISLLHEKFSFQVREHAQNQPCSRITKIYTLFQQNSLRPVYVVKLHIYAYLTWEAIFRQLTILLATGPSLDCFQWTNLKFEMVYLHLVVNPKLTWAL